MARQPFSSSMSDAFDPYGAMGGFPSRESMPTAYYFLRTVLIAGALAGGVVALYRNDLLLELSRRVGQEQRYLEFEKFFLGGSPGWGTPRSMQPVLAGDGTNGSEPTSPALAAPAEPTVAAAAVTTPSGAEPTAAPSQPAAAPNTLSQSAPSTVAAASNAPGDALAPVSLESLPLLGARGRSAPVSVNALPRSESAPAARAPVSTPHATAPATASGTKSRAIAVNLDDEEDISISAAPAARAPKAKPAPAPEPEPAPVAEKPQPKGPKLSDPRPNDNPLLGAIRSAVKARPAKDGVPQ